MYVILTTKPGQFRTEPGPDLQPIEAHDFVFYGRLRASFLIAQIGAPTRVRLVDETEPVTVNLVPSKFLEKFATLEGARRELQHLSPPGDAYAQLLPRAAALFNQHTGHTA
ncbi:ferredoxin [Macromonas nakdongensis]|uniref:ferredoxin n=1 Tax=Macromonas nakdongensis TaxID=1843082 RepID=UPI001E49C1C5|nr:ferredoxin [Macromonas nakdongensis]